MHLLEEGFVEGVDGGVQLASQYQRRLCVYMYMYMYSSLRSTNAAWWVHPHTHVCIHIQLASQYQRRLVGC